ncbi:hypothetical protein [Desulfothermobacter acidiphilus]|uniref:hypothetical protein n=1 Tax=Desulfothermobacter acidiphilus TaxID=1938353 RepID=UPI003F8C81DA
MRAQTVESRETVLLRIDPKTLRAGDFVLVPAEAAYNLRGREVAAEVVDVSHPHFVLFRSLRGGYHFTVHRQALLSGEAPVYVEVPAES